jgi:hypothetical protein
MNAGRFVIDEEQVRALRERYPNEPDQSWVPETAHTEGWLAVNRHYLEQERRRSSAAMRALMQALGIDHLASPEDAADLLELAVYVFAPEGGFTGTLTRPTPQTVRIENSSCPTFRLIEQQDWHGVTACASWHRRRGWLDALGVQASDTVLSEQKWGDAACVSVVSIERVPSQAA